MPSEISPAVGGGISSKSAVLWKPEPATALSYIVELRGGKRQRFGDGAPLFTLVVKNREQMEWLLRADAYSAAVAFIQGEYEVRGDLVAAIRFKLANRDISAKRLLFATLARLAPRRIESFWQSRARAAQNIRFHYDRSNEFYQQFLDSRMVYSCAYFKRLDWSLDMAQEAKLDLICQKLALAPGERFLDIGCGWGGLLLHAARRHGVHAMGCTLSRNQAEYARSRADSQGLRSNATIFDQDYREMRGGFHKIASVGMFEHVGRRRLRGYFRRIHALLEDDGLFLNHGIVRPCDVGDDAQTYFLQRRVFPGGELARLADVIQAAECAGFEVLDVECLRPHYALTCRAWVERLQDRAEVCTRLVGRETYRTWMLYLAGAAASFETAKTDVYQVLLAKRLSQAARFLTRSYMCAGETRGERDGERVSPEAVA